MTAPTTESVNGVPQRTPTYLRTYGRTNEEPLLPTSETSSSVTRTRAYEISQVDFGRMSWHSRQRLNNQLRAETTRLQAALNRLTYPAVIAEADAYDAQREARLILCRLPIDPEAAEHRRALLREINELQPKGKRGPRL